LRADQPTIARYQQDVERVIANAIIIETGDARRAVAQSAAISLARTATRAERADSELEAITPSRDARWMARKDSG
jgi:hypothetical protein